MQKVLMGDINFHEEAKVKVKIKDNGENKRHQSQRGKRKVKGRMKGADSDDNKHRMLEGEDKM